MTWHETASTTRNTGGLTAGYEPSSRKKSSAAASTAGDVTAPFTLPNHGTSDTKTNATPSPANVSTPDPSTKHAMSQPRHADEQPAEQHPRHTTPQVVRTQAVPGNHPTPKGAFKDQPQPLPPTCPWFSLSPRAELNGYPPKMYRLEALYGC